MAEYKKRVVDDLLKRKLDGAGAVLIVGPKWCGKTTTAEQQAKSVVYMDNAEKGADWVRMASLDSGMVLDGATPRLIDEWQLAPSLWDAVRFRVDHREREGQFILTGSAVPVDECATRHSGTGRVSWLHMRTMSLWESGESNGAVSLRSLFERSGKVSAECDLTLEDVAFLTCRGGWPKASTQKGDKSLDRAFDYFDAVAHQDISRADGVRRDSGRARRVMRSYARHQGAQVSLSAIAEDVRSGDAVDDKTVASYVNALKKIAVVEDLPAWNPNLRSKTAIRTSDCRYFSDPSVATAALGLGPADLMNDLRTFGLLFETLCVRDLRVFADALGGEVFHYRDKNGLECDAVVHLRNGSYGLVEIKLGGDALVEEGAKNLKALAAKIDTGRMKAPSFLMALTAVGKFAYRREDGVCVVPIGCLKD